MRKEAAEIVRAQIAKRDDFVKTLQDLYDASQVFCKDKGKLKEEIIKNEGEIKKIMTQLKILDMNFRKKDLLFTRYIQSLQETVKEELKENDSHWQLNPALITEKDFEHNLQEELLKVIKEKYFGEELFEKENIVKQYFIEIEKRERSIQELIVEQKHAVREMNEIEYKLHTSKEELSKMEKEAVHLESQYGDILYNREVIINTRVESRNQGLVKHLSTSYTADDFEKYLGVNKNLYKQVLRKFSSFNYRLLSKSDKEAFYELVVDDHSTKKNKYFDLIGQLIHDEAITTSWERTKEKLYNRIFKNSESYKELTKQIDSLTREINLLSESKSELRKNIELTLKTQINELEIEKKDLQVKYNLNYHKFKISELGKRLDELRKRLAKFQEQYDIAEDKYKEDIQKLMDEDLEIKKELLEYGIKKNMEQPEELKINEEEQNYITAKMVDHYTGNLTNSMPKSKPSKMALIKKSPIAPKTENYSKEDEDNSDMRKYSLTERSKSIDFGATLNNVNTEYAQMEKTKAGLEDLKIVNSNEQRQSMDSNAKESEDPFFLSSVEKVS